MEKVLKFFQNKKHLALYLVGVLLLSTGVSYAYFVSTVKTDGSGSIAKVSTATVISEGAIADGNINVSEIDIYPGHKTISSIKVTGIGDNEPKIYDVIFEGSNTFETNINYTVYKVSSDIEASYSCEKKQNVVDGSIHYYEECTGTNIDQLGEVIASGTISKGETTTTLVSDEIILTTEAGTEVYYYVVIEYPNLEDNQNNDIGSTISGNITIQEGGEYQSPTIVFTAVGTKESGYDWYKSASINTSITTQTGEYEVLYCIATSDSCEPDTTPSANNNFNLTLNNNSSSQKVCVKVTDEYNQTAEWCSEGYKVDGEAPSVNITSTSATTSTITVNVSASDSYSGIYQYKFSSNGGSSYTTVSSTNSSYSYTFTGLSSGTTYSIRVQVVDQAGNSSSTASTSVTTDEATKKVDTVLGELDVHIDGPTLRRTSCAIGTNDGGDCGVSENGVYEGTDDDGTTYYFRGTVDNNWVYFARYYWRIIRINGDGTIRLIYSGSSSTGAVTTGTNTQIQTSAFNNVASGSQYSYHVGYMYTESEDADIGQHGNTTSSTIKGVLDTWYYNNLRSYSSYIADSGFCGDRNLSSSTWVASGSSIYYAAINRDSGTPTFKCSNSEDLYTVSNSKGNQALTYPIGLITMDEVRYAGAYYTTSNYGYWLYTGSTYWTMTPFSFGAAGYARVSAVNSSGNLYNYYNLSTAYGVRPVINLSADVTLTGEGTATNPYRVS